MESSKSLVAVSSPPPSETNSLEAPPPSETTMDLVPSEADSQLANLVSGAHQQQPSTSIAPPSCSTSITPPSCSTPQPSPPWKRREGKQPIEEEEEEEKEEEEEVEKEEEKEEEEEERKRSPKPIEEEEEEEKEEEKKERKRSLWTVYRTVSLIHEWEKKAEGKKKLVTDDWVQLAEILSSLLGTPLTGRQCINKIHSLKKDYSLRLRSGNSSNWEYYEMMNSLMEKGLLTFQEKIEKKPERREKIEKKPERRKKVEKKIEKSEEKIEKSEEQKNIILALKDHGITGENLDNHLDNLTLGDLRAMVLSMACRVSKPEPPILVEEPEGEESASWNSESILTLIKLGKKRVCGRLECIHCQSEKLVEIDWRKLVEIDWRVGFLNQASYVLGKLYTGGAEAAAEATADFSGPLCHICKAAGLRPVSSVSGYNWLFIALTQTLHCIPQSILLQYLTAKKVNVSSESSPKKVLLKFYIYVFSQLDPMNGWDVMRV